MKTLFCINSLNVEIYLYGQKACGESILILLKCDEKCIFSVLIDSFFTDNFPFDNILKNEHILYFDLICWTHPHDDHSLGLKTIFEKYCDKNTELWIPEGSTVSNDNNSVQCKSLFKSIKQNLNSNSFMISTASDKKDLLQNKDSFKILYGTKEYQLIIDSLAPLSNRLIRNDYEVSSENDKSIVFYFSIGEQFYLFTGDSPNAVLNKIRFGNLDIMPDPVTFVKIPHHGSVSSQNLVTCLGKKISIAGTTVFRKHKLPNPETIDLYRSVSSEIVGTGHLGEEDDTDNYGMIHLNFDVLNNTRSIDFLGNACQIQ